MNAKLIKVIDTNSFDCQMPSGKIVNISEKEIFDAIKTEDFISELMNIKN